jgi:hypothetical protein
MNAKTILVYMDHVKTRSRTTTSHAHVMRVGPKMKTKRTAQKISMSVHSLSILVYMETAQIQRVVLIVFAKTVGRRKKMKISVLRTSMSVKKIRVNMEHAATQWVVLIVLAKTGGQRKKMERSVLRTSMSVK